MVHTAQPLRSPPNTLRSLGLWSKCHQIRTGILLLTLICTSNTKSVTCSKFLHQTARRMQRMLLLTCSFCNVSAYTCGLQVLQRNIYIYTIQIIWSVYHSLWYSICKIRDGEQCSNQPEYGPKITISSYGSILYPECYLLIKPGKHIVTTYLLILTALLT